MSDADGGTRPTGPQVMDLRPATAPTEPELVLLSSPAAELLRLLGVLTDDERDNYDVGPDRLERLRARLPEPLIERCRALDNGSNTTFAILSVIAAELPEPAGVDELLAAIERDPGLGWRLLLAQLASTDFDDANRDLGDAVLTGDPRAIDEMRGWAQTSDRPELARLLAMDPASFGTHLLEVVTTFRPIWEELEREAMGAIDRDVAHRRAQLAAGEPVAEVVVDATNGYDISGDRTLTRVVMMPSFWCRPWLVVAHHGGAEIISSVVADQFVQLPSEAPPPTLLKLFKALADEGRLKLVRRMSGGPITLTEATDELAVAKATAHHHLSILRQAGLVSMRGEGRAARYALREDPPELARETLRAYVHPLR
ncbi:MAG: winged helix-turn-helix transcriptional regulator [Nitriliruptoraceae bacterium]|nr:winged helix-turn-helix transcriptional regulator [Nitriliruptoraceae bacterium]